jgi:uncharacterized membrane protein YkoI
MEVPMRYLAYPLGAVLLSLGACASEETLAKNARISHEQATRTAEFAVGSSAEETYLDRENGRTVYKVELVNRDDTTQTVWVDAETGRIIKRDQ